MLELRVNPDRYHVGDLLVGELELKNLAQEERDVCIDSYAYYRILGSRERRSSIAGSNDGCNQRVRLEPLGTYRWPVGLGQIEAGDENLEIEVTQSVVDMSDHRYHDRTFLVSNRAKVVAELVPK